MMRRWLLWTLLLPLFCAGFGAGARAQAPTCSVLYSDMNFGDNIDILSNGSIAGYGTVTIDCSGLGGQQLARVCMGMNPAATIPQMVNQNDNSSPLYYGIFTDELHTKPWFSQLLKRPVEELSFSKTSASVRYYGRIRSGQSSSPVGLYVSFVTPPFRYFIYGSTSSPPDCETEGYDRTPVAFSVSAQITPNCKFTSQPRPMDFKDSGGDPTVITRDLTATTDLIFRCTTNAPYSVGLSAGDNNPGGGATTRRMCRSSDKVNCITYGLYADAGYGTPWGLIDPLASGSNTKPRTASSSGERITVYGKMPKPDVSPAPGYYFETITVTVNF